MERWRGVGWLLWLGGLVCLLEACGGGVAPVSRQPAESYPFRQLQHGLFVAVEPLLTSSQAQEVFPGGEDFPQQGLLPVRVVVENRGDQPVTVLREQFRLVRPGGGGEPAMSPQEAFALVKSRVGWWAALPVLGTSASAAQNAGRQRDFEARAWRDEAIRPGGSGEGFVFFYLQESDMNLGGSRIGLQARAASGAAWDYEIPIQGRRDLPAPPQRPKSLQAPSRQEGTGGQGIIIRSPAAP